MQKQKRKNIDNYKFQAHGMKTEKKVKSILCGVKEQNLSKKRNRKKKTQTKYILSHKPEKKFFKHNYSHEEISQSAEV